MSSSHSPRGRFHDPGDASSEADPAPQPLPSPQGSCGDAERGPTAAAAPAVPASPQALIALQRGGTLPLAPRGGAAADRLERLLAQIEGFGCDAWETQQICLVLLSQLERYHAQVVAAMDSDAEQAGAAQVACWAIDGDRLMHCRRLLESITLV